MNKYPPNEQRAYEAQLRRQFETEHAEEIEFMVQDGKYTAVLDNGTTIYDDCGDTVVYLYKASIDDVEALKCIVTAYNTGFRYGVDYGQRQKMAEICKVLGVHNG